MSEIFISYRRDDNSHAAGRLYSELSRLVPREHIFMDVDAIPPGADFVEVLEEKVAACRVLLAVIGPNWLEAKDRSGRRRLDDPNDFVRIEIVAALARNIPVVPVLMDSTPMPRAETLPDALKPLARRNAIVVSHLRFASDVARLVQGLYVGAQPSPTASTPALGRRRDAEIGTRENASESLEGSQPENEAPSNQLSPTMHSSIERRDDVQIGARENASELVEESQPDNSAHFDIDRKAPSPGLRKRAAVAGAVIVFGLVVGSLTRLFVFEAGRSFILDLTSGGMGAVSGAYGGFILAAVIYAVVIEDAVESDSIGDLILAALIVVLSIAGSIAGATVAIFLYRLVHGLVL